MIDNLLLAVYILSCVCNAIYYFWVAMLLAFPPVMNDYEQNEEIIDFTTYLVIPCLNEAKVIGNTIKNILNMGLDKICVVAINDGSEDNTLEILESFNSDKLIIVNRVLPNARQGKGEALNYAYRRILDHVEKNNFNPENVIVGILDADTFIKPSLIQRVNEIFYHDKKAGMVQARVRIGISTRDHILPFLQDIEFYSYINRMQNAREYMGTVAAAGNGQFNRLTAMKTLGDKPWSRCLLEDFDFSLRLLLSGWRTRILQDENIYQQGVMSYKKYVKQRARWVQGCIQCIPYAKEVLKSKYLSKWGKAEIFHFLSLPIISLLSILVLIVSWILISTSFMHRSTILFDKLAEYPTFYQALLLLILMIIIYLPGILFSINYWRDTREGFFRCLLAGIFMPLYTLLQIPAVVLAAYRQIRGYNSWTKTERTEDIIGG
ncbi:MAG: glycosyltransferase [Clostridiales bacterium]|nr:glycosyltransferase [Clostridiales bacterium]